MFATALSYFKNIQCPLLVPVENQRGQGLIEYLVIVALMGVATIGIVRVMGQTVSSRFASITYALQGRKQAVAADTVDAASYKRKDLGNFFDGVGGRGSSGRASGGSSGGLFGGSSGGSSGDSDQ